LTTGQLAVYSSLAAAVIPLLENENKDLIQNLVRVDSHKHAFGNRKISNDCCCAKDEIKDDTRRNQNEITKNYIIIIEQKNDTKLLILNSI
jgi:hypothetical protein